MNSLFIDNIQTIEHKPTAIEINNGLIQAMGAGITPSDSGIEKLDGQGMVVVPGLLNAHTHAAMTLFRGFGDDLPLMEWLETRIWPAEAKLDEEDVYWGTKLACLEMIRSGTVNFMDMYWHFHGMARAVEEMGLRAGVGAVMIDIAGEEQAEQCKKMARDTLEESSRYSDRIRYVLTPHAIYTVSEPSLKWVADFSTQHNLAAHIHLSETAFEVNQCLEQHGIRPAMLLDRAGLLNERTFLAHGVHLNEEELDLIAERGATLVTNPVSNMKLAVGGVFPYREAKKRGIPIAMGTDGAASNNSLDLFQDVKTMALLQKHHSGDPTTLPSHDAWEIATGAQAPLFGQSGKIAVGEAADLLLIRDRELEVWPNHDLVSNLVYAATGHVVDTTIVAGKVLMQNRTIEGEEEIRQQIARRAHRLCGD